MRKAINNEKIEGRIYQHNLTIKKVQNQTSANFGKEFISGDIEVAATDLIIYSAADTPPIYIKDDDNVDDNLRLKYRYLDLRKLKM